MEILNSVWTNAMVVFGLGFVIFIHELGHFLLAKWNGVKVEKFAIGFDVKGLKLYSRQVGETEYVLGAIPLGGYVKMLGEEPPAETDPESAPAPVASRDPRAYHNRPVGARMAIITAGVIMNLIFGLVCFTYVNMRGKYDQPPVIGSVQAGRPGYAAGLRPDDRIVAIDGNPIESFSQVIKATVFSSPGQVLRLDVVREGSEEPVRIEVLPDKAEGSTAPTIGATPGDSLDLARELPYDRPPGVSGEVAKTIKPLEGGRQIVAIGPVEGELSTVKTKAELDRILADDRDKPLRVEAGWAFDAEVDPSAPARVSATIPPSRFLDLGFRLRPGPIAAIQPGSPAALAGLKVGERIVGVEGVEPFDPMRLPEIAHDHAGAGSPLVLIVERSDPKAGQGEEVRRQVEITPTPAPIGHETRVGQTEPLKVPGLGLAMTILPVVDGVRPDSPASKVGLKADDRLMALTIDVAAETAEKPDPQRIELGSDRESDPSTSASWPYLFDRLQRLPSRPIELTYSRDADGSEGERTARVELTPAPVDGWYNPDRGLVFLSLSTKLPPRSLPAALRGGFEETVDNVTSVYYMIRGLAQRRIGTDGVGGLIPIFDMGRKMAKIGLLDAFIPFLGMLSVNLAVINFLPIPPLDGGQFLLLLAEKLRGRPLPERYVGPITFVGLLLLLVLIVAVNLKDVFNLF